MNPFVFRGHPPYLEGAMAPDDHSEVVRLASNNDLVAGCSNLLAQASDKSCSKANRAGIIEAAKHRARAARVAADCCQAMVVDVEANVDAPAPAGLVDSPPPGKPGLQRNPMVAIPGVVSESIEPAPLGVYTNRGEAGESQASAVPVARQLPDEPPIMPGIVNVDPTRDERQEPEQGTEPRRPKRR